MRQRAITRLEVTAIAGSACGRWSFLAAPPFSLTKPGRGMPLQPLFMRPTVKRKTRIFVSATS